MQRLVVVVVKKTASKWPKVVLVVILVVFQGVFFNLKKHEGQFSFYVFPKDPELRRKWLLDISRKNFTPMTFALIKDSSLRLSAQCAGAADLVLY